MTTTMPHVLLLSTCESKPENGQLKGHWRFVLDSLDGDERLDVHDVEPDLGERLELLAVLRGLEAVDQPSRVTLVTSSRYVIRGIRFGVDTWRDRQWQWENYGEMVPVKDADLWKRLNRAMEIHEIRLRHWNSQIDHDSRLTTCPVTASHDEYSPEYSAAVAG